MEFLSLSSIDNNHKNLNYRNKIDFYPTYCHQQGFTWNKLLKLAIKGSVNNMSRLISLPVEIVVLVSSFSLGINVGEYQFYLNSLNSKLESLRFHARRGNKHAYRYENERITESLSSLESKIGQDLETTGLKDYIINQTKKTQICPLGEKEYIRNRLKYYLDRTQSYADDGNEKMMIFLKKTTKVFIDENIPSAWTLLDNIQIKEEKTEYFKKNELKNTLQKASYYASKGDRISMNYYTRKILESEDIDNLAIQEDIKDIQDLLTPKLEKEFLISGLLRSLQYAENMSKLKNRDGMERYLRQTERYHCKLINLPIEIDHVDNMENYKKNIFCIFNCPL